MVGVNSEVSSKHDITVMQIIVLSSNFRSRIPLVGNQFSKVPKDRNNVSAKVPKQCQFVVGGWNKTKRKLTSTHFGPILFWNTSKVHYKRLSLCSILTSQQILLCSPKYITTSPVVTNLYKLKHECILQSQSTHARTSILSAHCPPL